MLAGWTNTGTNWLKNGVFDTIFLRQVWNQMIVVNLAA